MKRIDLTQGSIIKKLLVIALPIMGTQLMQMGYNLTDMFWLGRVGSEAVAASGTAGMFMWLSMAFVMVGRMGAEIGVSQSIGAGDMESAERYSKNSLYLSTLLGVSFMLLLVLFNKPLIALMGIQDANVVQDSEQYLIIVALAMPFNFVAAAFVGAFNGSGNSKTPFLVNAVGLVINIILDPVLILTFDMGVIGAAVATAISQMIGFLLMAFSITHSKKRPFELFKFKGKLDKGTSRQIFMWTTPIMFESLLFTLMSMITNTIINAFGTSAMTVTRVGSQIESLTWLIAGGFGSAITAFIGQNYGAGKWTRIHKGFSVSSITMVGYGFLTTLIMYLFGAALFEVFLPGDDAVRDMGKTYLQILAVCQVAQCMESVSSGVLKGIGKTLPPSIISIASNVLRVGLAFMMARTSLGLNGVFWAVTITATLRGLVMYAYYLYARRHFPRVDMV